MNLILAISLLLALGCAFYVRRHLAKRRSLRQARERRERNERSARRSFAPAKSERSQMRTDDDPTTVMERITETKPPANMTRKNDK
jgi:hypothetical protein